MWKQKWTDYKYLRFFYILVLYHSKVKNDRCGATLGWKWNGCIFFCIILYLNWNLVSYKSVSVFVLRVKARVNQKLLGVGQVVVGWGGRQLKRSLASATPLSSPYYYPAPPPLQIPSFFCSTTFTPHSYLNSQSFFTFWEYYKSLPSCNVM